MPLTKNDREFIRLVIKEEISAALEPVMNKNNEQDQTIRKHNQTLYGENGNNGINSDVKALKVKISNLETEKKQLIAWAAGVSATVSAFTYFIKHLFKGN